MGKTSDRNFLINKLIKHISTKEKHPIPVATRTLKQTPTFPETSSCSSFKSQFYFPPQIYSEDLNK